VVFSKIYSAQPNLLKAEGVNIETDLTRGLHSFSIIGLPDKSIEESRDRVSAAIKNSGFISPKQKNHKIIISLTPANIKKSGSIFDLPIAIGYLKSSKQIKVATSGKLFSGELSLDGNIKKIKGVIQIILYAKENGFKEVYIPKENKLEASLVRGIKIYGVENLKEIIMHLKGKEKLKEITTKKVFYDEKIEYDLKNIKGNEQAKRALLIAACGGHNICLHGPPGTGKTLLSKSFCGILPPLKYEEILEVSSIHSLSGNSTSLLINPPFRSPHHTASYSAIIGGGRDISPGEITLAHKGVLLMDEFPEFDNRVINSLRQPMEEKKVRISRTSKRVEYPCDFILVATLNPCPCGFKNSDTKECKCSSREIENYKRKLSGPIIDRIDIFIEVSKINYEKLLNKKEERSSGEFKKIVSNIRNLQFKRFSKLNSSLNFKELTKNIENDRLIKDFNKISEKLGVSTRSYYKILKVARTIADIENCDQIKMPHILEALQYRNHLNY